MGATMTHCEAGATEMKVTAKKGAGCGLWAAHCRDLGLLMFAVISGCLKAFSMLC